MQYIYILVSYSKSTKHCMSVLSLQGYKANLRFSSSMLFRLGRGGVRRQGAVLASRRPEVPGHCNHNPASQINHIK